MDSLSQDDDAIRRLFHKHVPEVASGIIQIRSNVREPGNRSIVVVSSNDPSLDAVGMCVGHRGCIVKRIVAELDGENIDIVLWNESAERFMANLLMPAHFIRANFDKSTRAVAVTLASDSISPPPAKLDLISKLLSRLTGWNLKVEPPDTRY